jgi:hypothetical protein
VAPDEGHGYARPVNNMAVLAAAERFLAKHLGGRYQESMTPEVATRLKEITVDVRKVTLPAVPQRGHEGASTREQFLGTWTGSWEGAGGAGGFELTLEKSKDGAVSGRVSVTGEPTYKAAFKKLSFDGTKMTATYDFPPDAGGEVLLTAVFDANTTSGKWLLREKTNGNEVATGGWTVTRR